MNDLFSSRSFSRDSHVVEMGISSSSPTAANLDKFFEDVESVKDELKELEKLYQNLYDSHEQSKTLHNAKAVKDLRSRMDSDVSLALKKAKLIKVRLEALDRSNASNRTQPGCGPGSSSDRTRTSVLSGLRKKLQDSMEGFNNLRQQISSEYRETVQRRYFTVTGENPDEKTIDILISTGELTPIHSVKFFAYQFWLVGWKLLGGNPTLANLGNDRGFISKEYILVWGLLGESKAKPRELMLKVDNIIPLCRSVILW